MSKKRKWLDAIRVVFSVRNLGVQPTGREDHMPVKKKCLENDVEEFEDHFCSCKFVSLKFYDLDL